MSISLYIWCIYLIQYIIHIYKSTGYTSSYIYMVHLFNTIHINIIHRYKLRGAGFTPTSIRKSLSSLSMSKSMPSTYWVLMPMVLWSSSFWKNKKNSCFKYTSMRDKRLLWKIGWGSSVFYDPQMKQIWIRPRFCSGMTYWTGDIRNDLLHETRPRCRIDRSTCWSVAQNTTILLHNVYMSSIVIDLGSSYNYLSIYILPELNHIWLLHREVMRCEKLTYRGLVQMATAENRTPDPLISVTLPNAFSIYSFGPQYS